MSNDEKYVDKTLKLPRFSGKQEDWQIWSEKFLIRAKRKGYKDLLLGKVIIPKDDESSTDARTDAEMDAIRELNELAFEEIEMGIDTEKKAGRVAFDYVRMSKTDDYTDGNCKMAWDRLKAKFESKQAPTRLLLRKEFYNKKLNSIEDDPDEWITELEDLRLRMKAAGSRLTDIDLIEHILNSLPKEYDIVVKMLENKLTNDNLTIMEVRDDLCLEYTKHKYSKDTKQETALYAGGFKGTCHKCGKMGHKARNCRSSGEQKTNQKDPNWKSKIECYKCHKKGHFAKECRSGKQDTSEKAKKATDKSKKKKKKRKDEDEDDDSSDSEMSLMIKEEFAMKTTDHERSLWIGDSGASGHMVNSDEHLYDVKEIDEEITIANDESLKATKIGKLRVEVMTKKGGMRIVLDQVRYIPGLGKYNLLSITKAMSKGFNLSNEGKVIILKKGEKELRFDEILKTRTGHVVGIKLKQLEKEKGLMSKEKERLKRIDIMEFHQKMGHISKATLEKVAETYGFKLTGTFEVCKACAEAKARQKNLGKKKTNGSENSPGRFLWMDVSSVKETSYGGSKFWCLILDDATNYSWSYFMKEKSDVGDAVKRTIKQIREFMKEEIVVRCDNAGENYSAEKTCKDKMEKVRFEFTSPNTPQQNGKVERKFATLYGRVRAMLNGARLEGLRRQKLWAECANHATLLENMTLTTRGFEMAPWWDPKRDEKRVRYLPTFGEVGVVKTAKEIQGKLTNKGETMMFVGCAENHAFDCYKFLNLKTNRIVKSRDVKWLRTTGKDLEEKERKVDEPTRTIDETFSDDESTDSEGSGIRIEEVDEDEEVEIDEVIGEDVEEEEEEVVQK